MKKLLSWLLNNLLVIILLIAVVYLFLLILSPFRNVYNTIDSRMGMEYSKSYTADFVGSSPMYYGRQPVPQMGITDRMTVTHSNLSLKVSNVRHSLDIIEEEVVNRGGYVVNSNLSSPEEGATGQITVRVPDDKLKEVLAILRSMSVKVVSETITGQDVTDQYMDIESRLVTLNSARDTYQNMLARAVTVEEILNVQQYLFNVQDQIDHLTGQLMYMETTSSSTLITVYLATDEFALPYTPDGAWRPELVFKQAVRSLLETVRALGSALIWIGVYAPLWAPVLVTFIIIRKILLRRISSQ
jgi:hypothetical protein